MRRSQMEFVKGRHGPKPVTGRFETREELERAVYELMGSGQSQNKIAQSCDVACATVNNIVKKMREDKLTKEADVKRAVLLGDWKLIGEVIGDGDGSGGVDDLGGGDVSAGGGDGVAVREDDAGCGGDRWAGSGGKNTGEIEIPAPGYTWKENHRY